MGGQEGSKEWALASNPRTRGRQRSVTDPQEKRPDMARKFLQMGFTRARRYANHKSGRKWSPGREEVLPPDVDPVKAESAAIFYEVYVRAREDPDYRRMKQEHLDRYPGEDG